MTQLDQMVWYLTLLVFGLLPRIPVRPANLPEQGNRMEAMHKARDEMAQLISIRRTNQALRANVPAAAI